MATQAHLSLPTVDTCNVSHTPPLATSTMFFSRVRSICRSKEYMPIQMINHLQQPTTEVDIVLSNVRKKGSS